MLSGDLFCKREHTVLTHRPLHVLGTDQSLDPSEHDPMFTKWRERTEQFRNRRELVCVVGEKNLADDWTRLFPWSKEKIKFLQDSAPPSVFKESDKCVQISSENAKSDPPGEVAVENEESKVATLNSKSQRVSKRTHWFQLLGILFLTTMVVRLTSTI